MADKAKVVVNINGQEFSVIGSESEEYIKGIAKYVDNNIKEIYNKNKKLSQSMLALLAAFNIADKYYKNLNELNEIKENVVEPLKDYERLKSEAGKNKEKLEAVREQSNAFKDELLQSKREIEYISKKNRQYEHALKLKEDELQNMQKIINDLQNKLFENQLELIQLKKELDESKKVLDKSRHI